MLNDWRVIAVLCVVPGLAPFSPEPHLWGKLRWLAGGAHGMQVMDHLDLIFHGFPFLLLARIAILRLRDRGIKE